MELDIVDLTIDDNTSDKPKQFERDLYKKMSRSKDIGRFVSIRPWVTSSGTMRLIIDIGTYNAETNKLASATNAFVDAIKLGTYLKAVTDGRAEIIYPADQRNMVDTAEGVTFFGGGKTDGKTISRVFKATHWQSGGSFDSSAFQWKIGHFNGEEAGSGIIKPDFNSPIAVNSIKMTRQEIAEISYGVQILLNTHAASVGNGAWYDG